MLNKKQPLVSVIMPVYNCEQYVEAALDSITQQTYTNLEIIAVDDCSKDNSWQVLQQCAKKDPRIKLLRNKQNIKQTRTRNFAIGQAKGDYVTFMDADDERILTSIEKQVQYLEDHPKAVVVGGAAEFCDETMNRINDRFYPTDDQAIRRAFFRYSPFCLASMMTRRECLDKDQPYKVAMEPAEDIDLAMRLGTIGEMGNLNEVIYRVRTHKQSVTQTYARVMEKNTLYLRIKAVLEYGYTITLADKFYFVAQLMTMYLMPGRFRFWLFNKLRAS